MLEAYIAHAGVTTPYTSLHYGAKLRALLAPATLRLLTPPAASRRRDQLEAIRLRLRGRRPRCLVGHDDQLLLLEGVRGEWPLLDRGERQPHRVEGLVVERRPHRLRGRRPLAHQLDGAVGHRDLLLVAHEVLAAQDQLEQR